MKLVPFLRPLSRLTILVWLSAGAGGFSLRGGGFGPEQTSVPGDLERIRRAIEAEVFAGRPDSLRLPVAAEDPEGRIWVAWEEWESRSSRIGVGLFLENRIVDSRWYGKPGEFALSPALAIDRRGSPWLIWLVSEIHGEHVCVLDLFSLRRWTFPAASDAAITNPKIVMDPSGSIWAFWNETYKDSGDIVYRVMEGASWSERKTIPRAGRWAGLNPDVAVDEEGLIWVAWSSYDGEDYELFFSRWDGSGWQKERRLTDNSVNDGFPSLSLTGGFAVVGWTRSLASGNQVCAMTMHQGQISGDIALSAPTHELVFPRVTPAAGGRAAVFWKTGQEVFVRELSPHQIGREGAPSVPSSTPPLIFNPWRDENGYIGFGDSITYGYIDRLPVPEKGYPPRLDVILDQSFGPTAVVNEGLGGEVTPAGLSRIDVVISTYEARYILIMEGTNDVINDPISMDVAAFNIKEMARKCLAAGLFPTIATIIPRHDWLGTVPFYHNRLLRLNDNIRAVAAELPVSFVDMFDLFNTYPESEGGVLSLLSEDLKHPSEKGYEFMAEAWFDEIRDYPFPPVDIQLRKTNPKRKTPEDMRNKPYWRPGWLLPVRTRKPGNLLQWKDNPKIFDPSRIKGYKIYRMRKGESMESFQLFAQVPAVSRFIDGNLQLHEDYIYLISTLRDDDVEGPCAGPINGL